MNEHAGLHPKTGRSARSGLLVSTVVSLLCLASGAGAYYVLSSLHRAPQRSSGGRPPLTVSVLEVKPGPYQEWLSGYGMARALRATAVPAEVAGVIAWVSPKLEAGTAVEQGTELVRLDERDLREAVVAARARLAEAKAASRRAGIRLESIQKQLAVARQEWEATQRELERVRRLRSAGAASESELDAQRLVAAAQQQALLQLEQQQETARPEMEQAAAQVEAAQAALDRAEHDLERAVIRAPYDGTIQSRSAQLGMHVQPGTALFQIIDLTRVEVAVPLPASRAPDVLVGAQVRLFATDGRQPIWHGQVARIAPTVHTTDRTFTAFVVVENNRSKVPVRPGAFVLARVEGKRHDRVVAVPRTAFIGDHLYVANKISQDGDVAEVHERKPTVERFLPDVALVRSGLEPGELVVLTNVEEIAEGSRVRVATEPPAPADQPAAANE